LRAQSKELIVPGQTREFFSKKRLKRMLATERMRQTFRALDFLNKLQA